MIRVQAYSILFIGFMVIFAVHRLAYGISGTTIIVEKGQPFHDIFAEDILDWPAGAQALANHPTRAVGWEFWFSGAASDARTFGYEIQSTRQVQELIDLLDKIEAPEVHVLLLRNAGQGPPLTSRYPDYAVTFRIGSQRVLDAWIQTLPGGKYGKLTFDEHTRAFPPTLYLHVGSGKFDLLGLRFPQRMSVKTDAEDPAAAGREPGAAGEAQRVINAFLETREENGDDE